MNGTASGNTPVDVFALIDVGVESDERMDWRAFRKSVRDALLVLDRPPPPPSLDQSRSAGTASESLLLSVAPDPGPWFWMAAYALKGARRQEGRWCRGTGPETRHPGRFEGTGHHRADQPLPCRKTRLNLTETRSPRSHG